MRMNYAAAVEAREEAERAMPFPVCSGPPEDHGRRHRRWLRVGKRNAIAAGCSALVSRLMHREVHM